MKIRTFFYCIRQGIVSTFKNKWFTLASIATIASCLFLFGIGFSIIWNVQSMVRTAEEGVSVTVFFDEGISDERIAEIGTLITGHSAVSKAVFVSADEAWEGFKQEYLGEYSDGFTENPLADSENYEIYLKDVKRQNELVQFLEGIDGVRRVNRSEVTANMLTGFNSLLTYVRSPFVIEGIIIGAIGALIPSGIIYVLYNKVIAYAMERYSMIFSVVHFLPVNEVFRYLFPVCIAVGVGIGFLGSFFTVRKHLRV